MWTYLKSMCPPPVWTVGGRCRGKPVGGLGVGVVGRLKGMHCKVGDARRRWSHM